MTRISTDPWQELKRPDRSGDVMARRVDPEHPWGFFWIRDSDNRRGLLLQCSADSAKAADPPALSGMSIGFLLQDRRGGTGAFVLRLNEPEHADVFHALCLDMLAHAATAGTEGDAVVAIIQRAWRWHFLLRKGRDGRLSVEEQKGLMGELLFMDEVLIDTFGAAPTVDAWTGPLGAAKDFTFGAVAVEIKACRMSRGPVIRISSEFQLDEADVAALFLGVIDISSGDREGGGSATLPEMVARVEARVTRDAPALLQQFQIRLLAVGYRAEDDYPERWSVGNLSLHVVAGTFPRLTPATIPSAVGAVRYSIPVPALREFQVDTARFIEAVQSQGNQYER
jgi:hypothetical protein